MKLNKLYLRNFKGIKEFSIDFKGKNISIFGENGTGKTSIFDAFLWLLFDKDSSNSSNFNVKTLDHLGNPIHGLEHEVKAEITLDNGQTVELQKIFKEKWTKKRGEADKELTGHTTDYFIDGVPKRLKDYKDFLAGVVDEETFRILTNPLYFNQKLDWKKRREVILNLCEDIDDSEVINNNSKLEELSQYLTNKSVEDVKAETAAKRRKLNEELKSIPYRIDELSREGLEDFDITGLEDKKKALLDQIEQLKEVQALGNIDKIRELRSEITNIQYTMKDIEREHTQQIKEKLSAIKSEVADLESEYRGINLQVKNSTNELEQTEKYISTKTERLNQLRKEYLEIDSMSFDESTNMCPTCGQDLPEEAKAEHIKEFEERKVKRLEKNIDEGKATKLEVESLEDKKLQIETDLKEQKNKLKEIEVAGTAKKEELKAVNDELNSIEIDSIKEYQDFKKKIEDIQNQIKELELKDKENDQSANIKAIEIEVQEINKKIATKELVENNKVRVEELKDRERELANMIANMEKVEFLCEQFVLDKAKLLEDKLNSKFKLVSFKLFNKLVNGGIEETFVTTVNGVPFDDLNNAMKINAGLDIINTLTSYYNFTAPIFIDNRESVNEIPNIASQVINLVVSKDKELKIEEVA